MEEMFSDVIDGRVEKVPDISVTKMSNRFLVPRESIYSWISRRRIFVFDNMVELEKANLFGAALAYFRRNYYSKDEAKRKLGTHLDQLVAEEKIRCKFYSGLIFFYKEDVDCAQNAGVIQIEKIPVKRRARNSVRNSAKNIVKAQPTSDGEVLITLIEASKILRVTVGALYYWLRDSDLVLADGRPVQMVGVKPGRRKFWMLKKSEIEEVAGQDYFAIGYLTYAEFAKQISDRPIGRDTITGWIAKGKLITIRAPGGLRHVRADQVEVGRHLAKTIRKSKR
jgi:hypothetical protein